MEVGETFTMAEVVVTIHRICRCVFTTLHKMCGQRWICERLEDLSVFQVLQKFDFLLVSMFEL